MRAKSATSMEMEDLIIYPEYRAGLERAAAELSLFVTGPEKRVAGIGPRDTCIASRANEPPGPESTMTAQPSRNFRVIIATTDEQEYFRVQGVCPDSYVLPRAVLVARPDLRAYRATHHIIADMSVGEYIRRCPEQVGRLLRSTCGERTCADVVQAFISTERVASPTAESYARMLAEDVRCLPLPEGLRWSVRVRYGRMCVSVLRDREVVRQAGRPWVPGCMDDATYRDLADEARSWRFANATAQAAVAVWN